MASPRQNWGAVVLLFVLIASGQVFANGESLFDFTLHFSFYYNIMISFLVVSSMTARMT